MDGDGMMRISLRAQIEELEYELRMRTEVYPRLVRRGRMRAGEAELHKQRLEAAIRTLRRHGRAGRCATNSPAGSILDGSGAGSLPVEGET